MHKPDHSLADYVWNIPTVNRLPIRRAKRAQSPTAIKLTTRIRVIGALGIALMCLLAVPMTALAGDSPSGFWWGSDSGGPAPTGSGPFKEATCAGAGNYGGYIGKIGGADYVSASNPSGNGTSIYTWNATAAADADTNHFTYGYGNGSGGYWYMYGPALTVGGGAGDSPYNWGVQQAEWALEDWQSWYDGGVHRMPFTIIWADVEGGSSYGWYTSPTSAEALADEEVFGGFFQEVNALDEGITAGIYSATGAWNVYTGAYDGLAGDWEWTYEDYQASATTCAQGWTADAGSTAQFFGGLSSSSNTALMWQWSSGSSDYDQIDSNRFS